MTAPDLRLIIQEATDRAFKIIPIRQAVIAADPRTSDDDLNRALAIAAKSPKIALEMVAALTGLARGAFASLLYQNPNIDLDGALAEIERHMIKIALQPEVQTNEARQ